MLQVFIYFIVCCLSLVHTHTHTDITVLQTLILGNISCEFRNCLTCWTWQGVLGARLLLDLLFSSCFAENLLVDHSTGPFESSVAFCL